MSLAKKVPRFLLKYFLINFSFQNFPSSCPKPVIVPMTDSVQDRLTNGQNLLRSTLALGQMGGVFAGVTARRMAQLVSSIYSFH